MKKQSFLLMVFLITLVTSNGCDNGNSPHTEVPINQFVGTWEAEHIYQSGYTDPVNFPIAAEKVNHTIVIKNDGSFISTKVLTYVDDSTINGSYTGTYEFTGMEITLTETSGIMMDNPVPDEQLHTTIYVLDEGFLTELDSNSYECPTEDEEGNLLYPIILNFVKQ